jgi:hypothetical protein
MDGYYTNFTGEAAKVLAVLAGFEAEIKRLTMENEQLRQQLNTKTISAVPTLSAWEIAPQEHIDDVENVLPIEEKLDEHQAKQHKRRGPNKPAEPETRCNALIPVLEMNAHGEIAPSQCKRSSENGCFCKQHADHQSYGTAEHPNLDMFQQHHHQLQKAFNKKNGIAESKKAKRPQSAVKRALNPYMMFLQVNRDRVKDELLAENPQLKGKELAMSITRHVGRLWQSAKGNAKDESDDCSECSQTESDIDRELDEMLGVN